MNLITAVVSIAATLAITQSNQEVEEYLTKFGYLPKNEEEDSSVTANYSTKLKYAITQFQEFYSLTTDGELNAETCALMQTPRCGVEDVPSSYHTSPFPWRKLNITWFYSGGTQLQVAIAERAFQTWSNVSRLNFHMSSTQPDIIISNKRGVHRFTKRRQQVCPYLLDGKGHVLAHAFFPNSNNTPVEIHMDEDEDWKYNGIGQTDFLGVLIHEIGHTLGIEHSSDKNSIMYAFYNGYTRLHNDDIAAVQSLYGRRRLDPFSSSTTTTTTKPPSSTTKKKSPPPTTPQPPPKPSDYLICQYETDDKIVVINSRLYIIRGNLAWSFPVDEEEFNNMQQPLPKPLKLNEWLSFLSKTVNKNITSVYQRPNGDVVLLVDGLLYMFDIHSLKLQYGYPTNATTQFGLPSTSVINTIINTYTGKTYVIYNDMYFAELDEGLYKTVKYGLVSDQFPGIPMRIDSAFRYTNGLLYFFKDSSFYEFSEFSKKLKQTGKIDYSRFGIKCYESVITNMFRIIISKFNFIPKHQST